MGIAIVQQAMSRTTFMHVKRYINFANNDELDVNDMMAKLRRFFDIRNRKFKQFGIWSKFLSIDEQMVPYFGRHSCKMFILGKPIRLGFKLWCLCSSTGYLFSFIPYCGQSDEYNRELGLGADVVLRLLSNGEAAMRHVVFFDNFFTSYHLLCLLSAKGLCATGTARCNRVAGGAINMKTGKICLAAHVIICTILRTRKSFVAGKLIRRSPLLQTMIRFCHSTLFGVGKRQLKLLRAWEKMGNLSTLTNLLCFTIITKEWVVLISTTMPFKIIE
ncbi:piggyBac transposable element-derived protein 3-like [Bactrocera neohumeralis]|uniref:piggyBac transposable element-derived protein 3-like n=1 Tax=Bactrocera neohumeralis TaxID=98809 RepID=UPI002165816B|nr:piggyBac transposable element-derived protein 3-like [Bactrocera neohumeralis]